MDTEEKWVSVEGVAGHLDVTKDTIYRWVRERDFPSHRAGNLLRFKLTEVDAWVRQDSDVSKNQQDTDTQKEN